MLFTKLICKITPCPNNKIMIKIRKIHNIVLSLLSIFMLVSIIYANYLTNKLFSFNNLLCKSYDNNKIALISAKIFLYSKYLEWGDTLFLHLSNKPISMLQYTHHMSTAFIVYLNTAEIMNSHYIVAMGLNCFVHVPMYWYFAYPNGFLKPYRLYITQIQIIQHIICIITSIYICFLDCDQNKYGNTFGLICYFMYLFYFSIFYIETYFI
jgi:hypothetical protein